MKVLIAFSFAGLFLASQTSVACTSIRDTYSGTVPANTDVIAQGPFTITGANGCRQANISSTITAVGAGSPPDLYIDKLTDSTWTKVAGGTGNTASVLGTLGTYRIRHSNTLTVDRQYSGSTRYSR
ncbi:hypothetical protein PS662_00585 [Pseudomonas fluorescens]|uniref:Spore coat protein U domain-containing protein n=1 Tax=Pseudomonas fluorescens TaxID=294 RepID=A0A5E6PTQ6_PSEFL|nr:hypothetical protein PS662_00585 [Pseudomonas fluorescens]